MEDTTPRRSKRSLIASITGIKNVKLKLENRSLTQKAFGEDLGISWSTISKFFNGKPVDRRVFVEICEALDLDWEDIVASPEKVDVETTSKENRTHSSFNQFQSLITDKTKEFIGREYVFNAIEKFIANQPNGYIKLKMFATDTIVNDFSPETGFLLLFQGLMLKF